MAEGGVPLEPESDDSSEEEVDEFDSLEMVFSRDFVTYVMKRRIPDWTFGQYYAAPCPITPFSFRVRNAIDFYLNKECINLDTLFHWAFMYEPMDYGGFVRVIDNVIDRVFRRVSSFNDLLRFLCLYAHFTAMASKRGVHMAPYYALFSIKELLGVYIHKKRMTPEYLFGELGFEAIRMIHENVPIDIYDID